MVRRCIMLAAIAALSACGASEPAEADLQSAMVHYYLGPESKIIDNQHIWLKGEHGFRQYVGVTKLACKPGGENPGFTCDVALETCIGKSADGCRPEKANLSGRFVKADSGWQFVPTDTATAPGRPVDLIHEIEMAGIMGSGGMAGCFSRTLSERDQQLAYRSGGEPCK